MVERLTRNDYYVDDDTFATLVDNYRNDIGMYRGQIHWSSYVCPRCGERMVVDLFRGVDVCSKCFRRFHILELR